MSANLMPLAFKNEDDISADLAWNKPYVDTLTKGGTRTLNLVVATYCASWNARHGFREFYQNWDDAIKETSNLGSRTFLKKRQDDPGFVGFVALHPDTKKELGFIRLSKKTGTLELTNYNSWLSAKSINLGTTSKRGNNFYAGHHGEGYKIATVALLRDKYLVKIRASKCTWDFFAASPGKKYEGEACVTFKIKRDEEDIKPMKDAYAARIATGRPRKRSGNIWEDVTVLIGGGKSKHVTVDEFMEWIKFALDLDPPSSVLETPDGSILLDAKFSNKVYLKGIFLEHAAALKPFKFGYNLAQGAVDRDRRTLSSPGEQGRLLAIIWGEAVRKDPTMIGEYLGMLKTEPAPGDVTNAEDYISPATATSIWTRLKEENANREKFYYQSQNGNEHIEIITKSLRKEPVPLTNVLWKMLRKHRMIKTPQEWRQRLLSNAPNSAIEDTIYSKGVKRALMGVLALDPRTEDHELVFKSGTDAELDLLLDGSRILVNDKWLDFHSSHESGSCDLLSEASDQQVSIDTFDCGHVITELYDLMLVELSRLPRIRSSSVLDNSLRRRVGEKIRQTPYRIEIAQGGRAGEIKVSWTESESDRVWKKYGLLRKGRITLHRESKCSNMKKQLLSPGVPEIPHEMSPHNGSTVKIAGCGCPERVVPLKNSSVIFEGLNEQEKYFPMISTVSPQSFYGLPPAAIQPAILEESADSPVALETPFVPEAQHWAPRQEQKEHFYDDIYDASSAGGDFDMDGHIDMDIDAEAPATSPSTSNSFSATGSTIQSSPIPIRAQVSNVGTAKQPSGAETKASNLIEELATANATVESLRDEVSRLTAENQSLVSQLETANENRAIIEQQLQAEQAELQTEKQQHATTCHKLKEAGTKLEQQQETLNAISETLANRDDEAMNLTREKENLQRRDQDAEGMIENLRTQLQQLISKNENLAAEVEQAERDLEDQVRVAGNLATRLRNASGRIKRERDEDVDESLGSKASSSSVKRQRGAVITMKQEDVLDLTEDV